MNAAERTRNQIKRTVDAEKRCALGKNRAVDADKCSADERNFNKYPEKYNTNFQEYKWANARESKHEEKTMAYIIIPTTDSGLVGFLKQFDTAMQEHSSALGFDAVDESIVTGANVEFESDLDALNAAKNAVKGFVTAKVNQRTASVSIIRNYAQRIKDNPAATPEIQASFGISTTPSSSGPVVVPTQLTAEPSANGTCRVSWNRNGNARGTTFTIETRGSTSGAWNFIGTTTKTKFNDSNATPGVARYYRVRASRGESVSAWSIETVIYSNGGSGFLEVAA